MLNQEDSRAAVLLLAAVIAFVPILGAQSKQGPMDGLVLGIHKGEHRELGMEGGALRTLENYLLKSHDNYDFVVQVDKAIFVGRLKFPLAAKSAASRLMLAWPAGTSVQLRLKKKGIFKKRMEMELVNEKGKKIPLLLVSVKDAIGRELCKRNGDPPDCANVSLRP